MRDRHLAEHPHHEHHEQRLRQDRRARRPGPVWLITAPEPTNNPAPITPPSEIIVTWRRLRPLWSPPLSMDHDHATRASPSSTICSSRSSATPPRRWARSTSTSATLPDLDDVDGDRLLRRRAGRVGPGVRARGRADPRGGGARDPVPRRLPRLAAAGPRARRRGRRACERRLVTWAPLDRDRRRPGARRDPGRRPRPALERGRHRAAAAARSRSTQRPRRRPRGGLPRRPPRVGRPVSSRGRRRPRSTAGTRNGASCSSPPG